MLGWKVMGAGIPGLAVMALTQDCGAALTAAGTTQGTALELGNADNEVTTAAAGSGVILSSKTAPGDMQTVFNAAANAVKVYPPTGFRINNLPTNDPALLGTNTGCIFKCVSTTRIFAVLSA